MAKTAVKYESLKWMGERIGWTMAQRNMFKTIQNELINECSDIYYSNWRRLIDDIELKKNEPKKFWENIQRIIGGKKDLTPYL